MDDRSPLLALLDTGYSALLRLARRFSTLRRLAMGILVTAYIVWLAVAVAALWVAWRRYDYFPFIMFLLLWVQSLVVPVIALLFLGRPLLFCDAALFLREAARHGDARLAPVGYQADLPTLSGDERGASVTFGPFRWPASPRAGWLLAGGLTYLLGGLIVVALVPFVAVRDLSERAGASRPAFDVALGFCGLVLVVCAVVILLTARRLSAGRLLITADGSGVHGRRFGLRPRAVALAWQDIRAIYRMDVPSLNRARTVSTVYALDGDDASLAWAVPANASEEVRAAGRKAIALAATRTGLPVRDLTASLLALASTSEIGRESLVSTWARQSPGLAGVAPRRYGTRGQLRYLVLAIGLIGALWGVQASLEWYEPHYYDGIVSQFRTGHPLYTNSLAAPDGVWPDQAAQGVETTYTGDAYRVSVTGATFFFALAPATYGDATVAVTMRQTGGVTYGDAGVVVRADPSRHTLIMFTADPFGVWKLIRMPDTPEHYVDGWTELAGGVSDAIHKGIGAENRLLIVMRGDEYLCYINDHFVGSAHDGTLRNGHVGVFVDIVAQQADFSDFAVYPA